VNILNPLTDDRWDDLVAHHPCASAFHQRGWLEALNRTYGYEPFVITTTPHGEPLRNGVVLCRVSSWLTGARLVSLPFSDHCELLLNEPTEYIEFIDWLKTEHERRGYKYVELRPLLDLQDLSSGLRSDRAYCFHELDLTPSVEQLFRNLHKDSIQRKIRRAERERLSCEEGCSEQLVHEFYRLVLMTRKRHQLPPQPRAWFNNLVRCMGHNVQIRLARKHTTPVAAMLTLRHRSSIIYKYGCSDETFHNYGGMPFLFWHLIEESKASGMEKIDFGRSDLDNSGLITFKDRFGSTRRSLTYYQYPRGAGRKAGTKWGAQAIKWVLSILPDGIVSCAGRVLYRHMG
jgi:CelD/BcsL family acetyltransferase involved in cellulose biosynthesis